MSDRRNENIVLIYFCFCLISPAVDVRPTISTACKFELHSDLTIQIFRLVVRDLLNCRCQVSLKVRSLSRFKIVVLYLFKRLRLFYWKSANCDKYFLN